MVWGTPQTGQRCHMVLRPWRKRSNLPVPPFQAVLPTNGEPEQSSFVSGILDIYDTCDSTPRMKNGDVAWKPMEEKDGRRSRPSRSGIAWWKWPSRSGLSASVWTSRRCSGIRSCMENTKHKIGLVLSMGFIVTLVGLSLSMGFIVITVGLSLSMDFLVDKLGLHLSTENILDKLGLCLSRSGLCSTRWPLWRWSGLHGASWCMGSTWQRSSRFLWPSAAWCGGRRIWSWKWRGSFYGPWHDSAGGMSTKSEFPDLPATASPLQFGGWLHFSSPVMNDISGAAGWWWGCTLREAKCHYERWRAHRFTEDSDSTSTPRITSRASLSQNWATWCANVAEGNPRHRATSPGTDRALSSTAILHCLMVRFQLGGAGEKQFLLKQLPDIPALKNVQDLAAAVRSWRRHFGRAQEVKAVLPDGVLLDGPLQQLAPMDQQAAFRLSQSRMMHLQLDEKPEHSSLWAFS